MGCRKLHVAPAHRAGIAALPIFRTSRPPLYFTLPPSYGVMPCCGMSCLRHVFFANVCKDSLALGAKQRFVVCGWECGIEYLLNF